MLISLLIIFLHFNLHFQDVILLQDVQHKQDAQGFIAAATKAGLHYHQMEVEQCGLLSISRFPIVHSGVHLFQSASVDGPSTGEKYVQLSAGELRGDLIEQCASWRRIVRRTAPSCWCVIFQAHDMQPV